MGTSILISKPDLAAASGIRRSPSLPAHLGVSASAQLSILLENYLAWGVGKWSLSQGLHRAASISLMWSIIGRTMVWMVFLATSPGKGASEQSCARVQLSVVGVITELRCPCILQGPFSNSRSGGTSMGWSPSACFFRFIYLFIHSHFRYSLECLLSDRYFSSPWEDSREQHRQKPLFCGDYILVGDTTKNKSGNKWTVSDSAMNKIREKMPDGDWVRVCVCVCTHGYTYFI